MLRLFCYAGAEVLMHLLVPQYQHGVIGPHAAVHVAAGFLVVAMLQEGARRGVQVGHAGRWQRTDDLTGR